MLTRESWRSWPNEDIASLEDLSQRCGHDLFLLALDGVEDPHNLGALLRTADGAGVDGVVLPERRAAGVNATVVKTSAGAAEHVRIARVTNLVRALEELKRQNVWCVGLDERGTADYDRFDYRCNFVLVLGGEGSGLHELTRRTCDHLLANSHGRPGIVTECFCGWRDCDVRGGTATPRGD